VPDRASATAAPVARPGPARWGDLRLRVLSALVLLPVGLVCLWLGGWAWAALVAAASLGVAVEYVALCRIASVAHSRVVLPASALAATALAFAGLEVGAVAAIAVAMALVWGAGGRIAPALGVPYVGLTAVALIWLRGADGAGRDSVLFVLLTVWATDISAYVAGRVVGGPRLAPSVSPGKTISGAVGGLAGALLVGWLSAAALGGARSPGCAPMLVAGALGIVAQAGDLMESWIKRRYGVKDSGHLIPGHGGLLDRLDGVLTAAPAAALLALLGGDAVRFWQ